VEASLTQVRVQRSDDPAGWWRHLLTTILLQFVAGETKLSSSSSR
jgi:hypothetical protein